MTSSSSQPRLMVLASTYPRWAGDPEPAFVHELTRRLTQEFDVVVLTPHAPGALPYECLDGVRVRRYRYAPEIFETLVHDGGIVTNLRRQPWKWLLVPGFVAGLLWQGWRLNRRQRQDIVHAHWLLPQGLAVALLARFTRGFPPFVVTSHGTDLYALRLPMLEAMKRFVVRSAAAVTVVSQPMLHELKRFGVEAKAAVHPMGVDLTGRFVPDGSVTRSPDEILFVGRLVENKGLRHLIDAMPMILEARPSAYLTVVGFGPEEAERKAQVRRLGLDEKVIFVGAMAQSELPSMYRRAAVFVAPFVQASSGAQEGLGLVTIEALGCGCPVVASDTPALREVARISELRLIPPESPGALANAVCATLSGGCATHAQVGNPDLRSRFDWSVAARSYAAVLRGAMS